MSSNRNPATMCVDGISMVLVWYTNFSVKLSGDLVILSVLNYICHLCEHSCLVI